MITCRRRPPRPCAWTGSLACAADKSRPRPEDRDSDGQQESKEGRGLRVKRRLGLGKKGNSSPRPGEGFEAQAARAIAQLHPELEVTHNQRLMTEPGLKRQFDVVGRIGGVVTHTFEARDRKREIDVEHVDGFETKNATLVEKKPRVAGIIQLTGILERPAHMGPPLQGQVCPRTIRTPAVHSEGLGRSPSSSQRRRTVYPNTEFDLFIENENDAAGREEDMLTVARFDGFLYDRNDRIAGNILDLLNRELTEAQQTGSGWTTGVVLFPLGAPDLDCWPEQSSAWPGSLFRGSCIPSGCAGGPFRTIPRHDRGCANRESNACRGPVAGARGLTKRIRPDAQVRR